MKTLIKLFITALAILPVLTNAQEKFSLKGTIKPSPKPAKAYLIYEDLNGKEFTDSTLIKAGKFQFSGSVQGTVLAFLFVDNTGAGFEKLKASRNTDKKKLYLAAENITINATDSISKGKISGSKINTEAEVYYLTTSAKAEEMMKEIDATYNRAPEAQKKDTAFLNPLKRRYSAGLLSSAALKKEYMLKNTDSYFSLSALNGIFASNEDVAAAEAVFNGFSAKLKQSGAGKKFMETMETARKTSVGAMSIDFTQNDVNDKPVKLSDFKGKYVLLDFWASWCGPCRAENPNVVKAYNTYKDKNFTVLGVSLDNPGKKEDWLKAIKNDGLTWTQVSDLKGWKNEASQLYGVRGIPANFLIDPQGKIVGKDLRGEALEEKLAELLK